MKEKFKTYNDQTKVEFEYTANWLSTWACSRTYGLGTQIPWDRQFVIESLSDSTIYWAYYVAKHYMHTDINGDEKGTLALDADKLDDSFFDYVFDNGGSADNLNEECKSKLEILDKIKTDFLYW